MIEKKKEKLIENLIYYRGVGYTQEEITEKLDIPQQTISRWLKKIKELEQDGLLYVAVKIQNKEN